MVLLCSFRKVLFTFVHLLYCIVYVFLFIVLGIRTEEIGEICKTGNVVPHP